MSRPTLTRPIVYPESDGKPMAETDVHRDWMVQLIELLKFLFSGLRVYVSGNLLVYYVEGNPRRSFAPDVFVVKDCDPRRRRTYQIWEEGKSPNFVLEVTSKKTRREDKGKKMELCAQLGVNEYFLYDPLGEWLDPPLQGYRLSGEHYEPIAPDSAGGLVSEQLGITFRLEDGQLMLHETATGKPILSAAERARNADERAANAQERALAAEQRAAQEAAARKILEEEVRRLKGQRSH